MFENSLKKQQLKSSEVKFKPLPTCFKTRIVQPDYRICPHCRQQIKPGGHRRCSGRYTGIRTIVSELEKRNMHELFVSKLISDKIGKNQVTKKTKSLNGGHITITTKRLRINKIEINDCIQFLRNNRLSKLKYRKSIAFYRKFDPNRLTEMPTYIMIMLRSWTPWTAGAKIWSSPSRCGLTTH